MLQRGIVYGMLAGFAIAGAMAFAPAPAIAAPKTPAVQTAAADTSDAKKEERKKRRAERRAYCKAHPDECKKQHEEWCAKHPDSCKPRAKGQHKGPGPNANPPPAKTE